MMHLFGQFVAAVLAAAQILTAPLAAVATFSRIGDTAPSIQTVLSGLEMGMSPEIVPPGGQGALWFSGKVQKEDAAGALYRSFMSDDALLPPAPVFSIPGYLISDPSLIVDPLDAEKMLLFFSRISNTDAASSTLMREKNHIGLARSNDRGFTWVDQGVLIGQENGIDSRGGWSPGVFVTGDEIWLYYSTNYPGKVEVQRARLSHEGALLGTDRVFLVDDGQKKLEGFNVEVDLQSNGWYVMYLNKDFSGITRYISEDGLRWRTAPDEKNPIIKADTGSLVAAPALEVVRNEDNVLLGHNLLFSGGRVSTKKFDEIVSIGDVGAVSARLTYRNALSDSVPTLGGGSGTGSGSGGSGSGGDSSTMFLGIAGVVGLVFLVAAISSTPTGVPFGGFVTAITPCVSPDGGAIWVTVVNPAGIGSGPYIWSLSTTIPFPMGPPIHPGQGVLGVADIPYACYTPYPPWVWPGLRIQYAGTSL